MKKTKAARFEMILQRVELNIRLQECFFAGDWAGYAENYLLSDAVSQTQHAANNQKGSWI